jgi:hypothetical protein
MCVRITILMLALLTTRAVAATQPSLVLFIDGKLASGNLIIIEGRSYVPVGDVAKALNMKLSKSGMVISLESIPSLTAVPTESQHTSQVEPAIQKGTIRGTVTYYFNANFGDKPDTGSTIWLVPREKWPYQDIEERGNRLLPPDVQVKGIGSRVLGYQSILLTSTEGSGKKALDIRIEGVRETTVDGNGNYEFRDVPEGNYIVIMQSSHTRGGRDGNPGARDILGRTDAMYVTVKPGEAVDCSNDFGMSAY